MSGKRHALRGPDGQFVAAGKRETELKRARGDRAGGRPQIRRKHKRALTRGELDLFLTVLVETCNVSAAAREVKRSTRVFYDLRRRDPGFRTEWLEALREGYDLLETEMVHRARFGAPKEVFHQGRKIATTRVFNDGVALRLLAQHRKSVEQMRAKDSAGSFDAKAVFDELAARVAEVKAARSREAKDGAA